MEKNRTQQKHPKEGTNSNNYFHENILGERLTP